MNILFTAAISLIVALGSFVGAYKYLPLNAFESAPTTFGSTITTIQGSDTLSASRTTINNNFASLNTGKFELSNWFATTSATQLITLGTITTGIWNGTAIGVGYGGTGTTSPTSNQVMLGNGASGFKVVSGFGSSGQFLTSGGASTVPSWTTAAIDQAANYSWTGHHIFSSSFTTAASSTNATSTKMWVTGLATAAGTLVAANPLGQLIATSSPVSSYVGSASATSTTNTATYTQDYSYTASFAPTIITLYYNLVGYVTSAARYTQGSCTYSGTSAVSGAYTTNNNASAITSAMAGIGCALSAGSSGSGNNMYSIAMQSVSGNVFTIRITFTGDSNGNTATASFYPIAYR